MKQSETDERAVSQDLDAGSQAPSQEEALGLAPGHISGISRHFAFALAIRRPQKRRRGRGAASDSDAQESLRTIPGSRGPRIG